MTESPKTQTVGEHPTSESVRSSVPIVLTRLMWLLWAGTFGLIAVYLRAGPWESGPFAVDGLTVVLWSTVTFFSAIVCSYSRRYMAGSNIIDQFFGRVLAFTLVVVVLAAADHLLLFVATWLAMGLVMAKLIGHVEDWPQAQAAAALARRYFIASTAAVGIALFVLWYYTGATTVSGLTPAVEGLSSPVILFAAGALLVAAMIQSALVPFQTWLLSSMTAPTPASALMHAGFVNAGGILLIRFGSVVTVDPAAMLVIVLAGAASALLGKLLKTVQTDIKSTLACSTTGQMGFMIMQAGLGFFAAALTHLILHGFYKAYQFLGSGSEISQQSPRKAADARSTGLGDTVVVVLTALAGGVVFALLTGKGTKLDSGFLLTMLVVLTVLHAARDIVGAASLPTTIRYSAVPVVSIPAVAVYGVVYRGIEAALAGLPATGQPAELSVVHGLVAAAFLAAYLAVETGIYKRSKRVYVALLNATHPPTETQLTTTEDYNEY